MPKGKPGSGKKLGPRTGPHRCAYQKGEERCEEIFTGSQRFCSRHSLATATPEQSQEAVLLGPEASAKLRVALGVDEARMMEQAWDEASEVLDEVPEPVTLSRKAAAKPGCETGPKPKPDESPVAFATRLALEQVAAMQRADLEDRKARRGEAALRMTPTDQARFGLSPYFQVLPDLAEMVDSKGKSLVKPGWVPRWVRIKDHEGRPTSRRLRQFYLMGAEDVIGEDGKALVDVLGKAIQIPPQAYAAWILHKSAAGAFDGGPYVGNAMQLAEDINRKARRHMVEVRTMPEHGSEVEEGPYGS